MQKKSIIQFIKFGLVGVSNTLVSQLVYMAGIAIGFHYTAANAAGFIISVFYAYMMQSRFVFKEEKDKEKRVWWKTLIKTYISYSFTCLFLASILLVLWIDIVKIDRFTPPLTEIVNSFGISIDNHGLAVTIAPLLNICINVPVNFLLNKLWAYRQAAKKED